MYHSSTLALILDWFLVDFNWVVSYLDIPRRSQSGGTSIHCLEISQLRFLKWLLFAPKETTLARRGWKGWLCGFIASRVLSKSLCKY